MDPNEERDQRILEDMINQGSNGAAAAAAHHEQGGEEEVSQYLNESGEDIEPKDDNVDGGDEAQHEEGEVGEPSAEPRKKRDPTKPLEGRFVFTEVSEEGEPVAPTEFCKKLIR